MYILELFKLGILTPARIARLSMHVLRHGVQLINVVHMCGDKHATALTHRGKSLTYDELFGSVASVSGYLRDTYQVREGNSVLIVADNSTPSVVLLFALSALGCHIHVCSPQKDYERFQ